MLKGRTFLWYFIGFWLLTMLLYRHGYGSQFVDDYITGIVRFMEEGWAGIVDSYDFTSLYYGHNIVFYGYYSLFGSSPLAWFLLFTGLHSLNATLAFGFIRRIFINNAFIQATAGAFIISVLFLVSPYQTENVIWGATLHYAVSLLCLWVMAWLYASYLGTGGGWKLWCCYILFAFSLLTLEISLVFPGILMLVFGFLWQPTNGLGQMVKHIKTIALPMAAIIVAYFGVTFLLKGHFIGHYGSNTHMQFQAGQLASGFWQYLAKLIGFAHYYPGKYKAFVYGSLGRPVIALSLLGVALAVLYVLWRYNKQRAWFALGWLGLIFVALLPVLNMYFMYLHSGENDRLSYVASVFILALPVLLLMWFARRLLWVYGLLSIAISIWLLQPQTQKWEHATRIQNLAVDSPLFYAEGDIYLLNLPCYYNGVYVFRSIERMHWARRYYQLPNIKPKTKYVLSANMHQPNDSVSVALLPQANTFKVELSAWGNWFWYNFLGAQNRTDEYVDVQVDEWGHSYTLLLPRLKPEDKVLYFSPNGWKEAPHP